MTEISAHDQSVPVSAERVEGCLYSARFWVDELPRYADRNQRKADVWAIAAGILAALTSLAIWPAFTNSDETAAKIAVSAVALLAAVCALVPRIMNYGELAGQARELTSRYGSLLGQLSDLHEMGDNLDQPRALQVVTEFEATKGKKDSLRGLPDKQLAEIDRAAVRLRAAEAKQRAAEAERQNAVAEAAIRDLDKPHQVQSDSPS